MSKKIFIILAGAILIVAFGLYYLSGPCGVLRVNSAYDELFWGLYPDIHYLEGDAFIWDQESLYVRDQENLDLVVSGYDDIINHTENIDVPTCLDNTKQILIEGLEISQYGLQLLYDGKDLTDPGDADKYSQEARDWGKYVTQGGGNFCSGVDYVSEAYRELERIKECSPFCEPLPIGSHELYFNDFRTLKGRIDSWGDCGEWRHED